MKLARKLVFYLLQIWLHIGYRFFFRKVILIDHRKVTSNRPIILAPNHQNSYFDALMTAIFVPQRFTFLARADVFKRPLMRQIAYLVSCLPVYRPHDGYATVKNNGETFDQCFDLLKEEESLLIFPEGNQYFSWRLRQLKKGLARIALNYNAKTEKNLPIVPVGIHFEEYMSFNKAIVVAFGDEMSSSKYLKTYLENPSQALSELTNDLRLEMDKLCISNDEPLKHDAINRLIFSEEYVSADAWRKRVAQINNNEFEFNNTVADTKQAAHWLLTPLALVGVAIFVFPYLLMQFLTKKLSPDQFFAPSIQFTLFLFIFTWYLIGASIAISLFTSIWIGLLFFLVSPLFGKYAMIWSRNTLG
jgi:1-acyl-sn-glycerol-3-phosphate acyltransferase